MARKTDWVKIIAIILAILFFIFWRTSVYISDSYFYECEEQSEEWEEAYNQLYSDWQDAYTTLNNCYQNGLSVCNVNVPT